MTDAVSTRTDRNVPAPARTVSPTSNPNVSTSSWSHRARKEPLESKPMTSLHPSVANTSEETTPTPTPANEPVQTPAEVSPEGERPNSSVSRQQLSPKQLDQGYPQLAHRPRQTWYPEPAPAQTWHATGSSPQSPVAHQYGGFQTPVQAQYPYDYSYAYAPQMAQGGYQPYAGPYYPMPFSPPAEAGPSPAPEHRVSRSVSGEEHDDLMNRIQNVLPDLSRLLEQYKEGQAPSTAAENPIKQFQLEQTEKLTSLKQELDANKKEYEKVIRKLVDENCTLKSEAEDRQRRSRSVEGDARGSRKLKSDFEALQAQHQNLANSVDSIRLSKEELIAEKLGIEKHIEWLKKDKQSIKDSHHRVLTDLKAQHLEELATRDSEHQRAISEHKSLLSKVQLDLATLISKHTTTKRELEVARSSEAAYKASAEARSKELEAAKAQHNQQFDKLKAEHQHTLESLKQEHKSQRQRHDSETKKRVTELDTFHAKQREWESSAQSLQAELQNNKDALVAQREAHASLRAIHEEHYKKTADLVSSMESWRQKHDELEKEKENVHQVLLALGLGSNATESTPEPKQPEPPTISNDKANPSEEAVNATEEPASKVTQETVAEPAGKASTPDLEESKGKEVFKEAEAKQFEVPTKGTEPPQATESAVSPTTPTTTVPPPVEVNDKPSPKEPASNLRTEKAMKEAAKATKAPAHTAEESIIFRPIHYYQVPGQYQ